MPCLLPDRCHDKQAADQAATRAEAEAPESILAAAPTVAADGLRAV